MTKYTGYRFFCLPGCDVFRSKVLMRPVVWEATLNFLPQVISPFLYPPSQFILLAQNSSWKGVYPESTVLDHIVFLFLYLFNSQKQVTKLETKYHGPGLWGLHWNHPREEAINMANQTSEPRVTEGVASTHCLNCLLLMKSQNSFHIYIFSVNI